MNPLHVSQKNEERLEVPKSITGLNIEKAVPSCSTPKCQPPQTLEAEFRWKIFTSSLFIIGGTSFLVGSGQYFPSATNLNLGGWLFTIGSACFVTAEALECWTKITQILEQNSSGDIAIDKLPNAASLSTALAGEHEPQLGYECFFALCATIMFLAGSVMFIPMFDNFVIACILFIVGCAVMLLVQMWKLYCKYVMSTPMSPAIVSLFLGLFAYLVGSVYFLPDYDVDEEYTLIAATWFMIGGVFYFISSMLVVYYSVYGTKNDRLTFA